MSQPQSEKRRHTRIPSTHPLLVCLAGGGALAERDLHETKVVGMGGLMFVGPRSYGVGTALQLDLAVRDRIVEASARVTYETRRPDGQYEIGVEFLRLSPSGETILNTLLQKSA